jgi:hypothetical protein
MYISTSKIIINIPRNKKIRMIKIVLDNKILVKARNFYHLGYSIGYKRDKYINTKLCTF